MTMMMKAVILPYPPSLSTLPPRTIGCFADLEQIGEGANGVVYRGRDKATGKTYALKKLELQDPGRSPDLVEQEIHYLSTYRHKSIIAFHEVLLPQADHDAAAGESNVYVVMEYAERDLLSQIHDVMCRPYREDEARTIMSDVLEGVHFLHSKGVIHRDIKTQNLLVTSTGKVKICDFDFCRDIGCRNDVGKPGNYTRGVGTPGYTAPELLLEEGGEYSAAVDVWSVGCVMAELLLFEDRLFGLDCYKGESMEVELDAIHQLLLSNERCLRDKFPPEMLSEDGFDLLSRMLAVFPENRITAKEALSHRWFRKPSYLARVFCLL